MKLKKTITLSWLAAVAILISGFIYLQNSYAYNPYDLKTGDIVFQETNSSQGKAVKAATNSRWTHVGMVFFKDDEPMVIEAVQPVKVTKLKDFIRRSPKSFYAMRLKNSDDAITPSSTEKAAKYADKLIGKNYDFKFRWSDEKIYCSELVWKIYHHATGIELCKPRPFKSYNLKHPSVQKIIKSRYGSAHNFPLNEVAVAPSDLAQSPLLIEAPRK